MRVTDLKFVGGAYSKAVIQRQTAAMRGSTSCCASAITVGGHGVDTKRRVVANFEVEVALKAAVVVGTYRRVDFMLGQQARLFADLVDDAPSRTPAKQHGGCAAQDFNAIGVENVAVVLRDVAHTVGVNVAGSTETA